jgi:hypothetical protein
MIWLLGAHDALIEGRIGHARDYLRRLEQQRPSRYSGSAGEALAAIEHGNFVKAVAIVSQMYRHFLSWVAPPPARFR